MNDATLSDGDMSGIQAQLRAAAPAQDHERLDDLRAELARRAAGEGLLDVAYEVADSPVGELLLATTERGLVRLAFACEGHERVLASLAERVSPRVLRAPARLQAARRQLAEYFDGRRQRFDLPLDRRLSSGFRGSVLQATGELGYGTTASYARVAAAAGSPRAVRATGSALATNPIPIVVPCHRVLRGDGTLGGYVGGLPAKRALLDLEARAAHYEP